MIPEELRGIFESLYEKAKANQVRWVVAADLGVGAAEDDFVVSFSDYSINVARPDEDHVFFGILDSKGKFLYSFLLEPHDSDFRIVEEIITIARRRVSGIDEALIKLRTALAQTGVVGLPNPPRLKADDDLPF